MWAWQVKYLFEFDAAAAGQVASSVHRILEREPRLKRYFVALPIDLPAGDMDPGPQGGRKLVSAHTRWAKSAREWEEAAAVLPDRASRIIGTAAGAVLGLPVTDFVQGMSASDSTRSSLLTSRPRPGNRQASHPGRRPGVGDEISQVQVISQRVTDRRVSARLDRWQTSRSGHGVRPWQHGEGGLRERC